MKKAAILISTKNRSNFLVELLNYYASVKFKHTIYIGDASDPQYMAETLSAIESLSCIINIVHKQCPELNRGAIDNQATIKKMIKYVEEEYLVFSGDDDFFIPPALDKCVDFLENNPEYSSAHGYGSFVGYDENARICRITGMYDVNEYKADSASERLKMLMNRYSVLLFSIHRKEAFYNLYQNIDLITHVLFVELLPVSLSSIQGKSKKIDELYLIRGVHEKRCTQPKMIEGFSDPEWYQSLLVYINTLSEEITKVDSIDQKDAKEIVRQVFSIYVENSVKKLYCGNSISLQRGIIQSIVNKIKEHIPLPIKQGILSIKDKKRLKNSAASRESYTQLKSVLMAFNRIMDKENEVYHN